MLRVLLGLLAIGAAAFDAGESNTKTAETDIALGRGDQWSSIEPHEAEALGAKRAALYGQQMRCAFTPGSRIGFQVTSVSFAECAKRFTEALAPISAHHRWNCEFAVLPGSDRKAILAWCPLTYALASNGEVVSSITTLRYDFDDAGLIVGFHQELDTSTFAPSAPAANMAAATSTSTRDRASPLVAVPFVGGLMAVAALARGAQQRQDRLLDESYEVLVDA